MVLFFDLFFYYRWVCLASHRCLFVVLCLCFFPKGRGNKLMSLLIFVKLQRVVKISTSSVG